MSALTLDRVLADAGRLPAEERELLEDWLRKRRSEAWRAETADQARKDIAAFRSGKLKAESMETVIARLRPRK